MAVTFSTINMNINYVAFYDASVPSTTSRTLTGADLFSDTFAAGDYVVFRISNATDFLPAKDVSISIDVAMAGTYTGIWEYYDATGATWRTLTCTDGTSGFTTTGVVSWNMSDIISMAFKTGDTANVRYRLTSVTTATEGGHFNANPQCGDASYHLTAQHTIADLITANAAHCVRSDANSASYTLYGAIVLDSGGSFVDSGKNLMLISKGRGGSTGNSSQMIQANGRVFSIGLWDSANTTAYQGGGVKSFKGFAGYCSHDWGDCVFNGYHIEVAAGSIESFTNMTFRQSILDFLDSTSRWGWPNNSTNIFTGCKFNGAFHGDNMVAPVYEGFEFLKRNGVASWRNTLLVYVCNSTIPTFASINGICTSHFYTDCLLPSNWSYTIINGWGVWYAMQTVIVQVTDSGDTPISGATVAMQDKNGATTITITSGGFSATTNADGYAGIVSGTASAGDATTLTDGTKSWTTNLYKGYAVMITSGTGSGQIRYIGSNTGTVLTIKNGWTTNPSTDSKYVILPKVVYKIANKNTSTNLDLNKFTMTVTATGYHFMQQKFNFVDKLGPVGTYDFPIQPIIGPEGGGDTYLYDLTAHDSTFY